MYRKHGVWEHSSARRGKAACPNRPARPTAWVDCDPQNRTRTMFQSIDLCCGKVCRLTCPSDTPSMRPEPLRADPRHPGRGQPREGPQSPRGKDIPRADEAGLDAICEVGHWSPSRAGQTPWSVFSVGACLTLGCGPMGLAWGLRTTPSRTLPGDLEAKGHPAPSWARHPGPEPEHPPPAGLLLEADLCTMPRRALLRPSLSPGSPFPGALPDSGQGPSSQQ